MQSIRQSQSIASKFRLLKEALKQRRDSNFLVYNVPTTIQKDRVKRKRAEAEVDILVDKVMMQVGAWQHVVADVSHDMDRMASPIDQPTEPSHTRFKGGFTHYNLKTNANKTHYSQLKQSPPQSEFNQIMDQ